MSTRNVRLSAIHAFFHFVASRNPEHLDLAQRVLGIPFKRARQRAIDYLEYEEIDAILKAIDRTTSQGSRDYALLATMFNTGARVQEIADLRACDLQLMLWNQFEVIERSSPQTTSYRTVCTSISYSLFARRGAVAAGSATAVSASR